MTKFSRFVSACALPIFLLTGGAATAANLIPSRTFNTVDWVANGGFQACSGNSGFLPCVNGSGGLQFAYVQATVTRSMTVTQPLHYVSFSVNGQGYFSADPGTVYLRAFDEGNQLLEEAVFTGDLPNGSILGVSLVLQDAAALATATRIEVAITGNDNNGWGGNYGTMFFGPQLFTNDLDKDGLEDDVDPLPNDASYLGNIKADKSGASVAYAGDVDGDGYGDYVIGIPGYDVPATPSAKIIKDAGRAEVISGRNGSILMFVNGVAAKDALGFAVAGGGDINNDGFDDVLVGAPSADNLPLKDTGSVTVLFGDSALPNQTFYGATAKTLFGSALALGDVNNDGWDDVIIGAPKADDVRDLALKLVDAGSVTVLSGEDYSELNTFYGSLAKAYFGTSVAAGDFDDDGDADIIVGAPNDDDLDHKRIDAGSVTVVSSTEDGLLKEYGTVAKAYLGKSVASGDVNDDGYADVLAGAPGDDDSEDALKDTGSVAIFSGFDSSLLAKHYDTTAKAGLGNSVAAADINGDGFADIIAGASKDDMPAIPKIIKDTGSVSIWSGADNAPISTLYGDVSKDVFGTAVSAGDVNSDGKADLIIGIPGKDIPPVLNPKAVTDAGAVKVISGASL